MKELNYDAHTRSALTDALTRLVEDKMVDKQVAEFKRFCESIFSGMRGRLFDLIDDCNTLESEVERLREENETLKKQMEDDLK